MASGEVVLNPGDLCFCCHGGGRVRTLLGSCVSITLWHPGRHIGGACHYMTPSRGGPPPSGRLDGRYADEAMALLLLKMNRCGSRPQEYEARMFGGGNQFPDTPTAFGLDVSRSNVETGIRLLREHGFAMAEGHYGGVGYRRLTFDLTTGGVDLTYVRQQPGGGRKAA